MNIYLNLNIYNLVIFFYLDIFGSLLRGAQSLQDATHLHGKDHRAVQRQKTARNATTRVRHCGQSLPIDVDRTGRPVDSVYGWIGRRQDREHEKGHSVFGPCRRQDEQDEQSDPRCRNFSQFYLLSFTLSLLFSYFRISIYIMFFLYIYWLSLFVIHSQLNANVAVLSPAASNAGLGFSDISTVENAAGAFLCVRIRLLLYYIFICFSFLFLVVFQSIFVCVLWLDSILIILN